MNSKRRILTFVLALVMVFALAVPAMALEVPEEAGSMDGKIVILHTNDVHARTGDNMGYATVAALKKAYEDLGAEVLLFDAGDALHGKPVATATQGRSIVRMMNSAGYDLMAPGNHDFNYGYERLLELTGSMDFPLLAANVTYDDTGKSVFQENVIFTVGGKKIGVFGLATDETVTKTNPNNVKGLSFNDPIKASEQQVKKLKAKGCDIIVCLGHIGMDSGSKYQSTIIANKVKGIDIFIDGHSHTTLNEGLKVKNTLICSTGEYINAIGVIIIDGKDISAGLVTKDDFSAKDARVDKFVKAYDTWVATLYSEKVGTTDVYLDGNRAPGVRTQETNLGDFAADAMLWAAQNVNPDVSLAITNGGGIRVPISPGTITKSNLVEVFPFGNQVCFLEIPGSVLLEVLEANCKDCPDANGGFPQVAGVSFTIDTSKTYKAGANNRIKDVKVAGEPLDLKKTYLIATNDFLAVGGDAYAAFAKYPMVSTGLNLEDALIDYLKSKLGGNVGSKYAEPAGRIIIK